MTISRKFLTAFLVVGLFGLVAVVGLSAAYPRVWSELRSGYSYGVASSAAPLYTEGGSSGYAARDMAMAPSAAMPPMAPDQLSEKMIAPEPYPSAGGAMEVKPADRLIVKNGTMSIEAKDVRWAANAITDYANKNGGSVVGTSIAKSGEVLSGYVTIRIPSANFEKAMGDMKNFGAVVSENSSAEDVTRQHVDLAARLKNLEASEAQLLELMKRSGSIPDVLSVQRELTTVRSEIESMQAQIKYLEQSASFSTLTVYISTDREALPVVQSPTERWQPKAIIKAAVRSLILVGQAAVNSLIWIVIFAPIWLPAVIIIWLLYRYVYRRMMR